MTLDELRTEAAKHGYHLVQNKCTKYTGPQCRDCIWLDMQGEKTVIGYECKCNYKHFRNPTTARYKSPSGKACSCFKAADDN